MTLSVMASHANDPSKTSIAAQDLRVLQRISQREQLNVEPELITKGWPLQKGERGVRFASRDNPKHALTVVLNDAGRVVKYLGNGPLLSNDSFPDLAQLTELRVIRIDHNVPGPGSSIPHDKFNGAGFSALVKSQLEEVRIGHAFDDTGMAALATIPSLKALDIVHSKVTDHGLQSLRGHPNLESFRISSQARPERITDRGVAVFATLPKLKELGLHETSLTYNNGLKHLSSAKTLSKLSLKHSLVLPADVEKLKNDRPNLIVETSTPAEIIAAPNTRGLARWASPEAVAYLKTGEKK